MRREYFYTNYHDLLAEFSHCADINDWVIETKEDFKREFEFFEVMLRETDTLAKEERLEEYDYDQDNDDGYVLFGSSLQNIDGAFAQHHYDPELFKDVDHALTFYEQRFNVTLH